MPCLYLAPLPLDQLWLKILVGVVVGLILGSFTTMLSYRLPRKISIIAPSSHCPKCETPLQVLDLIPVFSWLINKGRCRHCQQPIGARYLLIEFVTASLCLLAFIAIGFTVYLPIALIGIIWSIAITIIKLEN